MEQRDRYLFITLTILFLSGLTGKFLSAKEPVPEEVLASKAIVQLIQGKTAAVTSVKPQGDGLVYFSPNGQFKSLINNWLEVGYWMVNERDRLCIVPSRDHQKCRVLAGNWESVDQYVVKKDGSRLLELSYKNFREGYESFERAQSSLPALEKLNNKAITMLFSDKTVASETVSKGRTSLTYYHRDGTLELMRNGEKHSGTWRVTDKDRMCLKLEELQEKCRIIVKQGDTYSKYIVKKNGQHQKSVKYLRFLPGKQF